MEDTPMLAQPVLSEEARRTLGHLPRYRDDTDHAWAQEHMREANGYPDTWELARGRTAADLADRVDSDAATTTEAAHVHQLLPLLHAAGYVTHDQDHDVWAMTAAGLAALQA